MSDIDWDAVKVGDPDPNRGDDYDLTCDATLSDDRHGLWYCTRRRDHAAGPHVAGTGGVVGAVWS